MHKMCSDEPKCAVMKGCLVMMNHEKVARCKTTEERSFANLAVQKSHRNVAR